MPLGLYGCEATPANGKALAALRAALANTIGGVQAPMRKPTLLFHATHESGLDPETVITERRLLMLRRMLMTHPEWHPLVDNVYGWLAGRGAGGTPGGPPPSPLG